MINLKKYLNSIFCVLFFYTIAAQDQSNVYRLPNSDKIILITIGDITCCKADAIVNAANTDLVNGGGVCGAIFKAAGVDDLSKACQCFGQCPTGQARITDSFNLKQHGIKYIIHAVGPDCRLILEENQQDILLKNAYNHALLLTENKGITSIAFPFISSAIYQFPKERAAQHAIKTVLDYLQKNETSLQLVHFVLFSQEDFIIFNKKITELIINENN